MELGGVSPKILICVSRPRRKSKRMSVHCTVPIHAEFGILWGVYKTVHPSRFPYSTCKNTTRLLIRLLHTMTAFRREPCEILTINATVVKLYIFYPNIKIIRLKRHYLPLVLLPVLP